LALKIKCTIPTKVRSAALYFVRAINIQDGFTGRPVFTLRRFETHCIRMRQYEERASQQTFLFLDNAAPGSARRRLNVASMLLFFAGA
jgi:hypothetical protein